MCKPAQLEAARLNGLLAQALLLPHESRQQLDQLILSYCAKFQPTDEVESGLIQEMVAAKWRQKRAWALETSTLQLQLIRDEAEINQQFTHIDDGLKLAVAHESLCNESKVLAQLSRAEATYSRQFDRALKNLLQLRQAGIVSAPLEERQNEPNRKPVSQSALPEALDAAPVQNEPKPAAAFRAPSTETMAQILCDIERLTASYKQNPFFIPPGAEESAVPRPLAAWK